MKIYARTNSNFSQSNFDLMKKFAGTDLWIKAKIEGTSYSEYINIKSVTGEYYLGEVTYYGIYDNTVDDPRHKEDLRCWLELFINEEFPSIENDVRNVFINPNYIYTTEELKQIAGME